MPAAISAVDELNGDKARHALLLMSRALDLLDANGGPHDAAADLDHAICRLRDWIDQQRLNHRGTPRD
jgi:hypothetical protein